MKAINKIMALMIAGGALLTSCSDDFLDRVPSNNYTAESYYSSDASVVKAVEPLYNYAWFNYNSSAIINIGSQRANDGWNPWNVPEFSTFQITGINDAVINTWSSFYMVVSMSNQLIADLNQYCTDAVTDEVKNQAIGEAYFMRGVAYFNLVRAWGNVIVYEDNVAMTQTPVIPLTKEEDVLKFCIRDFRQAAKLMGDAAKNGHVSKYAAKAYLAKALLALSGWNKGTRDSNMLDECVRLCTDVIDHGGYSLDPDYGDLFTYAGNNNTKVNQEDIFSLKWADPITASWGAGDVKFANLGWSGSTDVNCWGGIYASVDMIDLFNEDPTDVARRKATFCYPGDWYENWDTGNDLIAAEKKTVANGYPEPRGYVFTKKIPYLKKYVPGTKADCGGHLGGSGNPCSALNTYMMRLADVYLTKAEAILGNAESTDIAAGVEALNAVRERAGVARKDKYSLEDIIKERRKEFCMEYVNWYDMVTWYRWKPQYMLNYFNNKQHRAFMISDGDIKLNEDGTVSYTTYPNRMNGAWYMDDWSTGEQLRWWSDGWHNTSGDLIEDAPIPYKSLDEMLLDLKMNTDKAYDPVVLKEENIFLPYPEADVLRNPYLKEPAQSYNFTWEVEE